MAWWEFVSCGIVFMSPPEAAHAAAQLKVTQLIDKGNAGKSFGELSLVLDGNFEIMEPKAFESQFLEINKDAIGAAAAPAAGAMIRGNPTQIDSKPSSHRGWKHHSRGASIDNETKRPDPVEGELDHAAIVRIQRHRQLRCRGH